MSPIRKFLIYWVCNSLNENPALSDGEVLDLSLKTIFGGIDFHQLYFVPIGKGPAACDIKIRVDKIIRSNGMTCVNAININSIVWHKITPYVIVRKKRKRYTGNNGQVVNNIF